jgi:hypothetical protein
MKLNDLMSEYRESLGTPVAPDFDALLRQQRRKTGRTWLVAMSAVAAAIAAVVFWPRPEVVRPVPPSEPSVAVVRHVPEVTAPVARRRAAAPRRLVRDEMAGFVAIAETSMLPRPQMLQVLRVNVSGNRLAALGVLRPDQTMRPSMMADVLLGDDGMARAIRVVANEQD